MVKKIFKKYRFTNKYNIIGDFDFLKLSLIRNYIIKEPLAIYNIINQFIHQKI